MVVECSVDFTNRKQYMILLLQNTLLAGVHRGWQLLAALLDRSSTFKGDRCVVHGLGLHILDCTHTHHSSYPGTPSLWQHNFGLLAKHLVAMLANWEFGDDRLATHVIALAEIVPVEH